MGMHVARQAIVIVNRATQCHCGINHGPDRRLRLRGGNHRALLHERDHCQQHEEAGGPSQACAQTKSHGDLLTPPREQEQAYFVQSLSVVLCLFGNTIPLMPRRAIFYALVSAALFGISTPAAKVLLGTIHPAILAGLLYSGAGIGVAVLRRLTPRIVRPANAREAPLQRKDIPWLAAAIAAGGIAGPLLLMFGLTRTDAATASLLLSLEGAATVLLAWFIFRENFDRRVTLGMLCLVAGAIILSWSGAPSLQDIC